MGIPDCNPILRCFISLIANLKTVVPFLGSHVSTVNGIHQQGFQIGFIPYIFPILRIFLFPFGVVSAKSPFPVPPGKAWNLLAFQFSGYEVDSMTIHRPLKNFPDNRCCLLINQKMSLFLRVFLISQWWNNACKLPLGCLQVVGSMNFLGNIPGIHLIQHVLERSNLIISVKGIYIIIQCDIPYAMLREKFLHQKSGLHMVTS